MSEWKPKRFWKAAQAEVAGDGFTVTLDGRPVRTPGKAALILPTRALAEAVAAEWGAQDGTVNPATMPLTRTANSAIDKVAAQHEEVAGLIADYGGTDLLCYRAFEPEELVARQNEVWDPLLDWASIALGARLQAVAGVMFVAQDPAVLALLEKRVRGLSPFELAAFHDLVSLSGSLIIGFCAACGHKTPEALWDASRLDEKWQADQWGIDDEAARQAAIKKTAFLDAARFWRLCQTA